MNEYNLNRLRDDVLICKEMATACLKHIEEKDLVKHNLQTVQGKLAWMLRMLDESLEEVKK